MGESYCREECSALRKAGTRCTPCPAPTLLPDCQAAVNAYLVCSTQWVYSPVGRAGLNYSASQSATDAHRDALQLPQWDALLPDLQTIEHAILQCDREHRDREAARRAAERPKP